MSGVSAYESSAGIRERAPSRYQPPALSILFCPASQAALCLAICRQHDGDRRYFSTTFSDLTVPCNVKLPFWKFHATGTILGKFLAGETFYLSCTCFSLDENLSFFKHFCLYFINFINCECSKYDCVCVMVWEEGIRFHAIRLLIINCSIFNALLSRCCEKYVQMKLYPCIIRDALYINF